MGVQRKKTIAIVVDASFREELERTASETSDIEIVETDRFDGLTVDVVHVVVLLTSASIPAIEKVLVDAIRARKRVEIRRKGLRRSLRILRYFDEIGDQILNLSGKPTSDEIVSVQKNIGGVVLGLGTEDILLTQLRTGYLRDSLCQWIHIYYGDVKGGELQLEGMGDLHSRLSSSMVDYENYVEDQFSIFFVSWIHELIERRNGWPIVCRRARI